MYVISCNGSGLSGDEANKVLNKYKSRERGVPEIKQVLGFTEDAFGF